jgi:hypothetical protein
MITHSVIVSAGARRRTHPVRHPSPNNPPRHRDDGFLAFLGDDDDFDLALLEVEHRIRRTALRAERSAHPLLGDGSAAVRGGEKHHRVKRPPLCRSLLSSFPSAGIDPVQEQVWRANFAIRSACCVGVLERLRGRTAAPCALIWQFEWLPKIAVMNFVETGLQPGPKEPAARLRRCRSSESAFSHARCSSR